MGGIIIAAITALPGVLLGIAGILSARRAHGAIANEVKPEAEQTRADLADVQEAVEHLKEGTLP